MTAPGKVRSEREVWADAAYRRRMRAARTAAGICSRCGKNPRRDDDTVWCLKCIVKHDAQDKKNRERIEEELRKIRPQMIALYGDPAAIWRDNGEGLTPVDRDDTIMGEIPNIFRAQKVLAAWMREA